MYIVDKKRKEAKEKIFKKCGCPKGCSKCFSKIRFIDRMADANIPVVYWFKRIDDFAGAPNIKASVVKYVSEIDVNFENGTSVCFTGSLGTGKTYGSCTILKNAMMKNYEAYYTTLSDLVFYMSEYEFKKDFYHKVSRADFLCVDEIDSRHFSDSDNSNNYFGRVFERILRYRIQNNLPVIMATNNASLDEVFTGQFKKTVESLSNISMLIVPALGADYRLKTGDK